MFERLFQLSENNTNIRTEVLAGVTTFMTMAYIIFVNPMILSDAGMDHGAVFVATCLAAAIGTLIMAFVANYPFALAPGMGLNAYFTYGIVLGMGLTWQVAMGAVFLSGILFFILSVLPIREYIINAIPQSLKMAISAGIGFFLGIIALQNAGIVVAYEPTIVGLGDMGDPAVLLAVAGFIAMIGMTSLGIPGALVIAMLAVTAIGVLLGISGFEGVFSAPPSLAPTLLQMDIAGALTVGLLTIIFAFLFVDLFDSAGTLVGVAHRAGFLDKEGRLPRLRQALMADSSATMAGAALGTTTTTTYVESAAGVNVGGRTGLTALVVAILFLAALVLAPLATTIPSYATAPAIFFVACLMARAFAELDWSDVTEYAPAVVTALAMPLTFSIADGIGFGFIAYVGAKLASGRWRDLSWTVVILALLFVVKFALLD